MPTTETWKKSRRVREISTTLTYEDTTSVEVFKLPSGTRILDWLVGVGTAFSGGTTDLDIGLSSDGDYLVDGLSLATAGRVALTTEMLQVNYETDGVTPVYMNVGAGNSAGSVTVTLLFSQVVDRRF
ncbi:MAG: hypothetical protein ACYSYL_00170 [Planctomycetota bacterium]|jgi:hypothetical protein